MSENSSFQQITENAQTAKRKIILDAVREVFKEQSINDISMRLIATKAGTSPASIYRYFPSQDDIFAEIHAEDIFEAISLLKHCKKNRDNLATIISNLIDFMIDNNAAFQIMVYFMVRERLDPLIAKKLNQIKQSFLNEFDDIIKNTSELNAFHLSTQAVCSYLVGIVVTFQNCLGKTSEEKRSDMHTLALSLLR